MDRQQINTSLFSSTISSSTEQEEPGQPFIHPKRKHSIITSFVSFKLKLPKSLDVSVIHSSQVKIACCWSLLYIYFWITVWEGGSSPSRFPSLSFLSLILMKSWMSTIERMKKQSRKHKASESTLHYFTCHYDYDRDSRVASKQNAVTWTRMRYQGKTPQSKTTSILCTHITPSRKGFQFQRSRSASITLFLFECRVRDTLRSR